MNYVITPGFAYGHQLIMDEDAACYVDLLLQFNSMQRARVRSWFGMSITRPADIWQRSKLPDSCLSPWQDIGYSLPFKRQRRLSRFDRRRKDFMRVDGYLPTYLRR